MPNGGFEAFTSEPVIPGWTQVYGAGEANVHFEVSPAAPYEGAGSLLLDDNNPSAGLGFESASFGVSASARYSVSAMMKVELGSLGMYVRFYDPSGVQIEEKGAWTPGTDGQWMKNEVTGTVPANALTAKVLVYSSASGLARGYTDAFRVELESMIANAGFETGGNGTSIPDWTQVFGAGASGMLYDTSSNASYEGSRSLLLDDNNTTVALGFESAAYPVTPGNSYSLSVMTKVERGTLGFYARYYNSAGVKLGETGSFVAFSNGQWENKTLSFTPPANTTKATVLIYSTAAGRGRGYADAVRVVQTTPALTNEGFEQNATLTIPSDWTQAFGAGEQNVVFDVSATETYEGARSLLLDDTSPTALLGFESAPFPVVTGLSYTASAMMKIERGSMGLYIRFFDAAGVKIAESGNFLTPTAGEWQKNATSTVVPVNAVTGKILIYSTGVGTARGYSDAVRVELNPIGTFKRIGSVVEGMINEDGAVGSENGKAVIYTLFKGRGEVPATFAVIDALSREVVRSYPLPGVEAAWGVKVATDGRVYIGTHYDGGLYRYTPGTNSFEHLGRFGSETHVFSLVAGPNGTMYAGTYPGGRLYEFDPADGQIRDMGQLDPEQRYVRSLAYDAARNILYAGVGGSKSRVFKINLTDGTKKELLGERIPGGGDTYTWPYGLSFVQDRLFVKMSNGDLLIIRAEDDAVEYYNPAGMDIHSERAIEIPGQPGKALFSYASDYYVYDSATISFQKLTGVEDGTNFADGRFIDLASPEWPGLTFVAVGRHGNIEYYNPTTGAAYALPASYSAPTLIQSIHNGPDGNIYVAGYMSGFTAYNPTDGTLSETNTLGQVESSAIRNGHMLIGAYAGSRVLDFDPALPWSDTNPVQLFDLRPYAQDRPFAMEYAADRDQLFVGNVPVPSSLQGALAAYDFRTGQLEVFNNLIPNQSIVSLLYKDGLLYGGSTIFGGLGTSGPTETEGKLFIFDPATKKIVYQTVPVAGRKGVTGLTLGPDGLIWGVAEDNIFKFDPNTRKVVSKIAKLRRYKTDGTVWTYGFLQPGLDGNMYGTSRGLFFMVKPATMEFILLNGSYGNYLNRDEYGTFYFSDNSADLWSYTPPYGEELKGLLDALRASKLKLDQTPVGDQLGQVPAAQRQVLLDARDAANAVKNTLNADTQTIVNAANALKAAMAQFDSAVVRLGTISFQAEQTELKRFETVTSSVYAATSLGTAVDMNSVELHYSSSDNTVVSVDAQGRVTANGEGTAIVSVLAMHPVAGSASAQLEFRVKPGLKKGQDPDKDRGSGK